MTKDQHAAPQLLCPTCKKRQTWSSKNPYRPFCSERCKLIDLGEWASEGHSIAGEPADFTDSSLPSSDFSPSDFSPNDLPYNDLPHNDFPKDSD